MRLDKREREVYIFKLAKHKLLAQSEVYTFKLASINALPTFFSFLFLSFFLSIYSRTYEVHST